jgi:hypothetical protein
MTWLRLSLVEICTVSGSSRQAASIKAVVRHGAHEVAAQADEGLHLAARMPSQASTVFRPLLARRLEAVLLLQLVERRQLRLLGDADRALALHVRMAAHRADAGAGLADIAAQQQQVDQHLHVLHAVPVLGQAHAVDADHGARRLQYTPRPLHGRALRAGPIRARSRSSAQRAPPPKALKPCVCSCRTRCRARAPCRLPRTRRPPSSTALHRPISTAVSPPAFSWWYWVLIGVSGRSASRAATADW